MLIESCVRKYEGHFKLDELVIQFKKFDGEWTPSVVREQISRGNAAAVMLYDPKKDKVALVEQLRVGCLSDNGDNTTASPWMLELVAGLVSSDEQAEQAAIREAAEEAGVVLSQLIPVCEYYNTPGALTEKTWIYCGLVDTTELGGVFGVVDEEENIQVHVLDFESVFSQLTEQRLLTSASTVIALQWLRLNKEMLKSKFDK